MTAPQRAPSSSSPQPRLVQGQRPLVVVHDVALGSIDHLDQLLALEQRKAVAGIDVGGNAAPLELAGVVEHRLLAVGGDDAQAEVHRELRELRLVRPGHRALVEGPDLVVVEIRRHEALRRAHVVEHPDGVAADPVPVEPLGVGSEVAADAGEDQRILAELAQVIGDVARHATKVRLEALDVEGHVQDVDLVRQDVVLEAVGKDHDVIERQRAGDENRHGNPRTAQSRRPRAERQWLPW